MKNEREINSKRLNEEFEIDIPSNQISTEVIDLEPDDSGNFDSDAEIVENIRKANVVYDRVLEAIEDGSFSAHLATAAASLTNAITTAISAKQSLYINDETLELKTKQLKLKEDELKIKIKEVNSKELNGNITNNILVIDSRENVLKAIREAKKLDSPSDIIDID